MTLVTLIVLLLALTASGEVNTRPKCNWAQEYMDFNKLLTDDAMQEHVMLMASEWEGKLAANNVGVDFCTATTYPFVAIDRDSGFAKPQVRPFISAL